MTLRGNLSPRLRLGLVVAAVLAAGAGLQASLRAPPLIVVRVQPVRAGHLRELVSGVSSGRVTAAREVVLLAELPGKVAWLGTRRGQRVAKDAPLLRYAVQELRERVELAEVEVALASAAVDRTAALDALALRLAHLSARQASLRIALAKRELDRAVVRAPFSGIVLSTLVAEGAFTPVGTPLLMLADTSAMHVEVEMDEADVHRLVPGMPAEVTLDALQGERVPGNLIDIAPSVTRDERGGKAVAIQVALPHDARLRVGMTAEVDVIISVREQAVAVPQNALRGHGTEQTIFVVEGGMVRRRMVEVGIRTVDGVEIRAGLRNGELVIAPLSMDSPPHGARVEVIQPKGDPGGGSS